MLLFCEILFGKDIDKKLDGNIVIAKQKMKVKAVTQYGISI